MKHAAGPQADAVNLFSGADGWGEGLRQLGMRAIGLELDETACRTAHAAGHPTIRTDATRYPTAPFARHRGHIASPPCQTWSQGGKHAGLSDEPLVHQALHDLAHGRDTRAGIRAACKDPRSLLAAEPMRWHHDLRPEWICLEQVPAVIGMWRHYAEVLTGWGYSTWAGILHCADYGLGQSRRRAILIASRVRPVGPPPRTHAEHPAEDLFGPALLPWRTMADVLLWGYTRRPSPTVTGGGTETGGAEPFSSTSRKAMQAAMDNPDHWAWKRPSPSAPGTNGHVGGKQAGGHLNLTLAEAAALQSFRLGYPFQGLKGKRSLQIGNAVPPLLAAHVVSAATGIPLAAAAPVALAVAG